MAKKIVNPAQGIQARNENQKSVENMISGNNYLSEDTFTRQAPPSTKINIQAREKKTQRINVYLMPSVVQKSKEKCKDLNLSLSELINQLLSIWNEQEE